MDREGGVQSLVQAEGDVSGIAISSGDTYRGEGVSSGLARGLVVHCGGRNVTREGLGIGTPVLRSDRFTFFSRRIRTERLSGNRITRIFSIDTRLVWYIGGRQSFRLTRLSERLSDLYMRYPPLQRGIALVPRIRTFCGISPAFEDIPPLAEARFDYAVSRGAVTVSCRIRSLQGVLPRIYLLNELAGDTFRAGRDQGSTIPPPPGWQEIGRPLPSPALCDPESTLWFRLASLAVRGDVPARVFWGREDAGDICWAGFEIELAPPRGTATEVDCRYRIEFDRGEPDG
ncbi:MAG: hypothetical protein KO206_05740 [Methanomicrobiaceae archaeon]|nr:hypothetical protein [Methanomicrobiaceae archaeon]